MRTYSQTILFLFFVAATASPSLSEARDNRFSANIRNFSTGLPLLHVNTAGKTATKAKEVIATVTVMDSGKNSSTELLRSAPTLTAKFQVRGNSSAKFSKKQYDLDLVDAADHDKDAPISFLGLPKHHKWVLAAPYSDRALIRNSFGFAFARSLKNAQGEESYASRTRPIELFLNGKYQGVYVLTEKIDNSKDRLNLGKVKWDNPSQSPFIVKVEKTKSRDPKEFFHTPFGSKVTYFEPKAKHFAKQMKTNPQGAKAMQKQIQSTMIRFEKAIAAIDEGDYKTYRELIDVTSFQNFMFVHEIMKNIDGFRRSVYVYYKDGKLHLGPVWDFDLAMANLTLFGQKRPKGFQVGHDRYIDFNRENFWFRTLLKDPSFQRDYVRRYRELRRAGGPLSTGALLRLIDSQANPMKQASDRNFTVWDYNGDRVDGIVIMFTPKFRNFEYSGHIQGMKKWLVKRLEWLDENFDDIGTGYSAAPPAETDFYDFRNEGN